MLKKTDVSELRSQGRSVGQVFLRVYDLWRSSRERHVVYGEILQFNPEVVCTSKHKGLFTPKVEEKLTRTLARMDSGTSQVF